ncbi:MAG: septum formation initiator family protein [Nitrospirales bacterium]
MKKNVLLGVMVVLGVWCLFYVGVKLDMWRLGYDMEELEQRRTVLKKQQEMLQVKLSELTDPQQIAQRAHRQLGLIVPQEGQVVMISLDLNSLPESGNGSPMRLVREFSDSFLSLP